MVYITGDCHADRKRFGADYFTEQREMARGKFIMFYEQIVRIVSCR